jgi:hypothetical protein
MIIALHTLHGVQNASAPLRLSQNSLPTSHASNLRLPLNLTVYDLVTVRNASPRLFSKTDKGPSVARANYL